MVTCREQEARSATRHGAPEGNVTALRGDIKQYDELLHKRRDLATDERKARIEQMKANTERMRRDSDPEEEEGVEVVNDAKEEMQRFLNREAEKGSTEIEALKALAEIPGIKFPGQKKVE